MSEPSVAVIVLTHADYTQRFLAQCIDSLNRQTYPHERFEIFIVSNGVSADDQRLIGQLAPGARVLHNAANLGWSGGNNTALRIALQEPFDYFVMLNINVVVEPDWLAHLVHAAHEHSDLQILQSAILLHGTNTVNSLGNRIHYLGYGTCHGYGQTLEQAGPSPIIDYASGAAMLVKREVFERIGLFREDYFIYYDDVEFCWRARLAGYYVGLAERARCAHHYEFQNTLRFMYELQRNRLMTVLTLERFRTVLVILPCLLVGELVLGVYFLLRGWGAIQGRVLAHFLKPSTWRLIREGRRTARQLRRRTDAEIVRHFAGQVIFAEADTPLLRYVVNPLLACYWMVARRLIV